MAICTLIDFRSTVDASNFKRQSTMVIHATWAGTKGRRPCLTGCHQIRCQASARTSSLPPGGGNNVLTILKTMGSSKMTFDASSRSSRKPADNVCIKYIVSTYRGMTITATATHRIRKIKPASHHLQRVKTRACHWRGHSSISRSLHHARQPIPVSAFWSGGRPHQYLSS